MEKQKEGWIHADERPPTSADADEWGCVMVWHIYQGPMITGWRQVEHNCFMTHWQHTPVPPKEYQEGKRPTLNELRRGVGRRQSIRMPKGKRKAVKPRTLHSTGIELNASRGKYPYLL